MTIIRNGKVVKGYEANCSCGWVGPWVDVKSIAGYEFCPACDKSHAGFIPREYVDRREKRTSSDAEQVRVENEQLRNGAKNETI